VDYEVVPEGEEPYEELDLKDRPHWEVVEESSCPFLHCSEPAFNTVPLTECFVDPFEAKGFRASGYHGPLSTRITGLFVHASNTQEGFSVEDIPLP
jgi:hypothetical protein